MSVGILALLHFKWDFVQPLVLQAVLPWKNLLTAPVIAVNLFGKKAAGDLQRPWKAPSAFPGLSPSSK